MDQLMAELRIQRETEPLCLEARQPEFLWRLLSRARGVMQTGFRLRVTDSRGNPLWETAADTNSQRILYAGPELLPETEYLVFLQVRDTLGRTAVARGRFRTGLRAAGFDDPAWGGAQWIGTGTRSLWAPALSVYALSCEITLQPGARSAGLIYGANDPRLMDRDKNIWGLEARRFQSYVYLKLDTAPLDQGEPAALELYRVGYTAEDGRKAPLYTLPIPTEVLNPDTRYAPHTLRLTSVYGMQDFFLDDVQLSKPEKNAGPFQSAQRNLNPAGQGGDFTTFPNLCDIGCKLEPGQAARYRNLTVRNYRKPGNILARFWEEGETFSAGDAGFFRIFDPSNTGIPMVRTEFSAKAVRRAWLTITARGIYTAWLNGKRVGEDYLAPGLTQYNQTHLYQVYDVTDLLQEGQNALGVELGEGWWSGSISFRGENWNFWGDCQSVLLKLTLENGDGETETIVSAPERFTASDQGPIRYASLFQGQVYDAFYAPLTEGWTRPGFRGNWQPAAALPLSAENALLGPYNGGLGPASGESVMDYSGQKVLGQIGPGVRCVKRLPALRMEEVRPGVYVYDFGQNIAGIPELQLPGGLPGQEVTIRYGEMCYPKLPEYGDNQGMLMLENLRGAHVTDVVYLGAEPLVFRPELTFHGFRYLELTGIDGPLPLEDVAALALSSVAELTADYQCADRRVNRLFQNICWSFRDNFLSIPTDCPQRNERMGWSGDLSVFSGTAVALGDVDTFLKRHMIALRDLQNEAGMFPDIAPVASGFGGILWGSVGMTAPWNAYLRYGDRALLEPHYDAMARYMAYLSRHVDPQTGLQTAGELGDWLGPQNGKTENALLWTAYYLYDLWILCQVTRLLKKPGGERWERQYQAGKRRFNDIFFDPETHVTVYSGKDAARGNRMPFQPVEESAPLPPREPGGGYRMDTMTSYCVPLGLGLVEQRHLDGALQNLARCCREGGKDDAGNALPPYSLMTGFIGTAWLLPALDMGGNYGEAYRLLTADHYPSWLYPVEQGATTIWERLDSYTKERGFGGHNSMNSFNHYSFGAVGQWLLAGSLGLQLSGAPEGENLLRPVPDPTGTITWARGYSETPYGRFESGWEIRSPGEIVYTLTVPAGCGARLRLPPAEEITLVGDANGVQPTGMTGEYLLSSGTYQFIASVITGRF